jgi:NAD(P)-dependent dehydrogenase (short-subunit alcohol dehydrogenase family)
MTIPSFNPVNFGLSGRVALVTGASRGIGQAIAVALAQAGADMVLAGREPKTLEETADAIRMLGRKAHVQRLDVSYVGRIGAAFAAIAESAGGIDILVNNAGIEQVKPSLEVDEALWDRLLDTNLKGAFFCAQAAARLMSKAGRGGTILNLCSLASEVGIATAAPYGASKTGLLGMTRALATEWAPLGTRVNGIGPGYFRTALTEVFYEDEAWQSAMLAKIPLARFGRMEDLIGAAIFLCSSAAAYITGQVLYVDGGFLASI